MAYEANCAGQGCDEAPRCRRFQMRMPTKESRGTQNPVFEWASLDIERRVFGDCVNFVRYHERRV